MPIIVLTEAFGEDEEIENVAAAFCRKSHALYGRDELLGEKQLAQALNEGKLVVIRESIPRTEINNNYHLEQYPEIENGMPIRVLLVPALISCSDSASLPSQIAPGETEIIYRQPDPNNMDWSCFGWLDVELLEEAVSKNRASVIFLTRITLLSYLKKIFINEGDKHLLGIPGWKTDPLDARNFLEFPAGLNRFIDFVEGMSGLPVIGVSLGATDQGVVWKNGITNVIERYRDSLNDIPSVDDLLKRGV